MPHGRPPVSPRRTPMQPHDPLPRRAIEVGSGGVPARLGRRIVARSQRRWRPNRIPPSGRVRPRAVPPRAKPPSRTMIRISGSVKFRWALGCGVPSGAAGGALRGRSLSTPGAGGSSSSSSAACWSCWAAIVINPRLLRRRRRRILGLGTQVVRHPCSSEARRFAVSFLSASRTSRIFARRSSRRRSSAGRSCCG